LCGSDIQSHSAKGAIGIRIDGVQDYNLENVYIHDIVNWGDLGSDACGEYEQITFEIGVDVDKDIQYGYSGDNVHGILTDYAFGSMKNVQIDNLKSLHGSANAIALYKGSKAELGGSFAINDIVAGSAITKSEADKLKLPNASPFVCSIFIGPNSQSDSQPELTPIVTVSDDFVASTTALYGHDYCSEDARIGTMQSVQNPEVLLLRLEELQNVHVVFGNFMFSSFSSSIAMFLMMAVAILAAMIFTFVVNLKANRKNKYGKGTTKTNLNYPEGNRTKTTAYGTI